MKLLFSLSFLLLLGCGPNELPISQYEEEYAGRHVYEVRFDGCQYVSISASGGYCHKGNCDNPIHCYNK